LAVSHGATRGMGRSLTAKKQAPATKLSGIPKLANHVSSSGLLGRACRLLGDAIDDVGFDAINPGGSKPVEGLVLHVAGHVSAHLIDRPPQAADRKSV